MVTNTQCHSSCTSSVRPPNLSVDHAELSDCGSKGSPLWLSISAGLVVLNGVLLVLDTLGAGVGTLVQQVAWAATGISLILAMINGNAVQKRLHAALVFIFFSIVFWALYEQAGGSLSIFALNNVRDKLFGFITSDPNVVNNGANALFIIMFAPVRGLLWLWLDKRKLEPTPW